ncbi:hypothetical protein PP635_gp09 [Arthrobacter phage Auxilium]|uniref:Uncharacterized protein n=1 Tax=Arthrobacter phage Auxilium TaxID=2419948 RepID=A0A3G2KA36_9CAUD|nr:hypothetical protein PP635_gp09 [Arthrobacter phage Auxilium]AYN55789.1 hypothetical protein PBI_AUXILIUM_9 [Arthrobacter phage Auxilium]
MSKLNTYVHVHDKDGISHAFGPEDTVPEWAEKAITNPDVWAEAPAAEETAEPESGESEGSEPETEEIPEGDITEEWTVKQLRAYAKAEDIDLGGATTKKDILSALAK